MEKYYKSNDLTYNQFYAVYNIVALNTQLYCQFGRLSESEFDYSNISSDVFTKLVYGIYDEIEKYMKHKLVREDKEFIYDKVKQQFKIG